MLPYPRELRERVVAAVEQGIYTIIEIANIFGVGPTFVKKMLRLHRAGESLEPRHGGGATPLLQEKELAFLRKEIEQNSDATLEELQNALAKKLHVEASLPTICRALQEIGLPRKKKASSLRSVTKKNAASSKR
jgi:transposase